MKQIDLTVAAVLDIVGINKDETRHIDFTAEEDWTGTYELAMYNSQAKNEKTIIAGAVMVDGLTLTWELSPALQGIPSAKRYFEITDVDQQTVIIKAEVTIDK
ncbi:hypothetical protein [Flavobacterium caeni]|uniref:Uncharacterized protein n=1 Tax=Flavobacterium caeni TaxID=490189 RepID=A0A1G5K4U5_9FLAO|nr:hypothetical protein [Flavobacterium caeni]SCY94909.1 hypothetical protein SAMN02927903_03062 [Flavobacterium caeni]